MYYVELDESNFYTGNYASIGTLPNGINVEKLPPSENSLCYKLVDKEITKEASQPILQYIKTTASDTEFETIYTIESLDENGNTITTSLTKEEYETLDDNDKKSVNVSQIAKIITVTLTKDAFDVLDETEKSEFTASYKEDENGNIVYETVQTTEIIKDWEFSQEKYDELEEKRIAEEEQSKADKEYQESISNETLKAENAMLTEQITMLTECLLEMSETVYA